MNEKTTQDLADRTWSVPEAVPVDAPPAESWEGLLGMSPPGPMTLGELSESEG